MKTSIIILFVLLTAITSSAQQNQGSTFQTQSYYGFSGLSFIPNSATAQPGQIGISYSSKPASGSEINLLPYSVRINYGWKGELIELAVSNTPFYSSDRLYGGVSVSHGIPDYALVVPVFPSVKYRLMSMTPSNYHVAMAVGFALPYGGYYVVDKFFDIGYFDLTVHSGVGTKLTTYHVFAGVTTTFGHRVGQIQRDFNLEMMIEAAWGGSLKELNKKEEAFISLSFRHSWTSRLFITTFIRYDNQPLMQDDEIISSGPTVRMGLGLDYHWE
jgi:hypothetical protein